MTITAKCSQHLQCVPCRYEVPEVMCQDVSRRECSDLTVLQPAALPLPLQSAQPSYEGHCSPRTLSLQQKHCKPQPKQTNSYAYLRI